MNRLKETHTHTDNVHILCYSLIIDKIVHIADIYNGIEEDEFKQEV